MRAINQKKRTCAAIVTLAMLAAVLMNAVGCAMDVQAADLMEGIRANSVSGKRADDDFITGTANFSIKLLQRTTQKDENMMISPLSVMLALAMTANGADGATKTQMSEMLGGEIPLETLNEYLYSYVKELPSEENSKLEIDVYKRQLLKQSEAGSQNNMWSIYLVDREERHFNEICFDFGYPRKLSGPARGS